jgi:hypothetical protein
MSLDAPGVPLTARTQQRKHIEIKNLEFQYQNFKHQACPLGTQSQRHALSKVLSVGRGVMASRWLPQPVWLLAGFPELYGSVFAACCVEIPVG